MQRVSDVPATSSSDSVYDAYNIFIYIYILRALKLQDWTKTDETTQDWKFRAVPVKNRTPWWTALERRPQYPPDISIPETSRGSGFLGVALGQTPRILDLHITALPGLENFYIGGHVSCLYRAAVLCRLHVT